MNAFIEIVVKYEELQKLFNVLGETGNQVCIGKIPAGATIINASTDNGDLKILYECASSGGDKDISLDFVRDDEGNLVLNIGKL